MVASTFVGDKHNELNTVVIRTVGYSHNGQLPSRSGGAFNTTYYNPQAPNYNSFTRVSGELFLGTYNFDGNEIRSDGVAFDARPTSLSFSYKYVPQQSVSRGSVEVIVYDEKGSVINQRKIYLYETDGMRDGKITLHRYPFGVRPGKVCIRFLSSDLELGQNIETKLPTGSELDEGIRNLFKETTIADNSAHAMCIGSELTVSNLRFNYGEKQND